jgi:transcriptional regulator with XRE-family HTH domain
MRGLTLLASLRIDRGLTLKRVAADTGLATRTIRRYEQARTTRPNAESIEALARYFDVRASTLVLDMQAFAEARDDPRSRRA